MKRRTLAIIDMQIGCQQCLQSNSALYADYQPLVNAAAELDSRIKAIRLKQQEIETDLKPFAKEKKEKLQWMALLADALRKKVQAVMLAKKDSQGYRTFNITRSDITSGAGLSAYTKAQIIFTAADNLSQADKTSYQITQDELDALDTAITKYDDAYKAIKQTKVERRNCRKFLSKMVSENSAFIRTVINSLMGNYLVNNQSFFSAWVMAKEIKNPSQRHSMITGMVTDQVNGQPLQMVKVKASSGDRVYEDMTDNQGKYKLPVNPEVWDVAFELPSYKGVNKTHIIVDAAERQILNVSLDPVER